MVVVPLRNRCVTLSAPNAVKLKKKPGFKTATNQSLHCCIKRILHALGHFGDYGTIWLQHISFTWDNYAFMGSSIAFQGHPNE